MEQTDPPTVRIPAWIRFTASNLSIAVAVLAVFVGLPILAYSGPAGVLAALFILAVTWLIVRRMFP